MVMAGGGSFYCNNGGAGPAMGEGADRAVVLAWLGGPLGANRGPVRQVLVESAVRFDRVAELGPV